MAKFLKGNELNSELERLFEEANHNIILISPYIKLHNRYISVLKEKLNNHKLQITIVFGKNEEDKSKSMQLEDFNFFKEFPNIEIRYEKNLHAKYYANDSAAIITSMNLYSFSQDNNIEAGIYLKQSILGSVTGDNTLEGEAWTYFKRVIEQSELLFKNVPEYDSNLLGLNKKYKASVVEQDKLTDFFSSITQPKITKTTFTKKPTIQLGYCIRTGKRIPFNPNSPLSDEAYQSWQKFSNKDYPEKYCHFSGEESKGETSFSKPILRKNWKQAKEHFAAK
jgi:hypothetical protein